MKRPYLASGLDYQGRHSCHRALPLPAHWPTRHECETYGECNDWPARRAPSPEPFPVVVDRAREDFDADDQGESADADDQTESADGEVALYIVKLVGAICAACFLAWARANGHL